ncbi:MAG: toxin-antitoxin system HicB family antitoxin [Acidobacteriota bacterium]|jgi:predicted nucleotidyltransferase
MKDSHQYQPASGRFLLRLYPGLHAALREAAAAKGVSLNDYCIQKLAAPFGSPLGAGASQAVAFAAALLGGSLVGVLVFGSWARAESRRESDIDLLIVADDSVEITRELYRQWDASPVHWDDHPVEPHFVHLPPFGGKPTPFWAEVAVDGIVLFSRSLDLPARLGQIRRDIASGCIVRRVVHGQPYWVEAK